MSQSVVCALVVLVLAFLQLQLGEAFMDAFMWDAGWRLERVGVLLNSTQEAEQRGRTAACGRCLQLLGAGKAWERRRGTSTNGNSPVAARQASRVPGAASATQKSSAAPLSESNAKARLLV
ncbi:unnamed protein product [Symbiodinium natans]|uniref:Secreted protein n=1 Tax=Symbiodinium natans TaxID=878477 RepID=A0A812UKZ0_9DINO|nr:unnamed protein product [Symbiodinium natans]